MLRASWCLLLLTLTCLFGACERPTPIPAGPTRVAALAPAITHMFTDLKAGSLLVARHAWDQTRTDLPIAGDQSGIDYEALLAAKPTHVLLQWGERDLPRRLLELAVEHNWTVKSFPLLTLEDIQSAVAWIHASVVTQAVNAQTGAALPAVPPPDILKAIDALKRPTFTGRVLLLHSASPPEVLGPGSYHHELLVRIGGVPAVTTGKAFMTLDAEDVLRMNPDAILFIQPRGTDAPAFATPRDAKSLADRLGRLATLDIAAVRTGRIALIDDPLALMPSTNLVDIARQMRDVLAEWAAASAPGTPPASPPTP